MPMFSNRENMSAEEAVKDIWMNYIKQSLEGQQLLSKLKCRNFIREIKTNAAKLDHIGPGGSQEGTCNGNK